jgi:dienelactone hydrolase
MKYSRLTPIVLSIAFAGAGLFSSGRASAEIRTQHVDYKQGNEVFEGYLAYDDASKGKRPGIVIVHGKRGLGEFAEGRARELAKLGYVAFAADAYGKGIRPQEDDAATVQSQKLKNDRPLTRKRIQAAYDVLRRNPLVDTAKLAVTGYCMGGMVALELARSGAPLGAVAIFHGTLATPAPEDAKNIKGRVLVMHGADDQNVPQPEVQAFIKEMRDAKVDFQLELYSGTVHGFTEPENLPGPGKKTAYNERSAKKSWASMQDLFHEVFQD